MNLIVSSREAVSLLKTSRDLQMLFAVVSHLVEGLRLETLQTLKVEKSLIIIIRIIIISGLCGLVVRVPGYRSRGPGFDSRRYQIF
jgi:hypothetical protein